MIETLYLTDNNLRISSRDEAPLKHAAFGTKNGPINIAGLQKANIEIVAKAFIDVLSEEF